MEKAGRAKVRSSIEKFCEELLERGLRPSTVVNYRCDLEKIEKWLRAERDKDLVEDQLTPLDIDSFREYLGQRYQLSTANRNLAVLRRWLDAVGRDDLLEYAGKFRLKLGMKKLDRVPRRLTREEERRLLDVARNHGDAIHFAALLLLLRSGRRVSEVCNLRWEDVDLKANKAGVSTEWVKSNSRRYLTLIDAEASAVLRQLRLKTPSRPNSFVFALSGKQVTRRMLERMLEKYSKEAKINRLTLRALRETHAMQLVENGVDPLTLAALLGHTSVSNVQRYYRRQNVPGGENPDEAPRKSYYWGEDRNRHTRKT
jgi:site-specific recombinase XerD